VVKKEGKMRWKRVLVIFAFLVLALFITAYIIVSRYDFNSLKPEITRAAREATGRELNLAGNIHLKIGLTPALVVQGVSFQNASWGSRPEMAKIKRFEIQVAVLPLLFGEIDVKRLVLVEPDILVETDPSGRSNLEFKVPKSEKPKEPEKKPPAGGKLKLPALTVNELQIEKGHLTYRDGRTGRTYALELETLTATAAGSENPIKMKLVGTYNGEPFEVSGRLFPLSAWTKPGTPGPVDLTIKAAGATFTIDGTIKDVSAQRGLEIHLSAKGNDLAGFQKLAGKPLPVKGPFEFSGRLTDPAAKTYRVSGFKVAFGPSDLSGSAEVNLGSRRPNLTAELSSQTIDLRSLSAEGNEKGKEGKPSGASVKKERIFPNDPLPLDSLGQVDASVKIRAGRVLLPRLALNDLTADMTLKDGRLAIRPIKAVIGGGNLDGRVDLQPQGKVAALTAVLKIDHLDVGRMAKELNVTDVVEGKLDAEIDLRGRGSSIANLMAGLNGKTTLSMGKGQINNKSIELLGGDLSSGIFRLLNPAKEETKYTTLNCFVCGLNIKDGLADTTALVFDTSQMSVIGDGKIDLGAEKLNISLKPVPKEGLGTKMTGKITLSLSELARPFKLTGTFAHPSLGIDTTQAAITLGKAVGGYALFGPVGIVSSLVGGTAGEENPCLAAIEAAKKGVKVEKKGPAGQTKEGIEEGVKGIEKEFKKLFGQ
jgi:uncharacterized protein involved in outer membrane biogenesis